MFKISRSYLKLLIIIYCFSKTLIECSVHNGSKCAHSLNDATFVRTKRGAGDKVSGRMQMSQPERSTVESLLSTSQQATNDGQQTGSRLANNGNLNDQRIQCQTPMIEGRAASARNKRQLNRFGTGPDPNRSNRERPGSTRNKNNQNVEKCQDGQEQQQQQQELMSRAKVLETAVFIDQALDNRFNGISNGLVELNKLVLAIMNQVQLLFRYSSLQVPLTLKLVLVEHIKESERQFENLPAPYPARGDIDAYLGNFCNWQQMRLEREKRLWWDHAILLSGLDLYKATPDRNHSGVLGLAWVGGMCKANYSCTINEASNFEASFVIAHEIGHSLGIMHDGQRNRCDPNGYIMSERTGAGKVHWSRCSNSYLNDSIQRGQLKCLDTEQNGHIDSLYDLSKLRSPGQVYSINEQCKLAFGNNHTSFVTHDHPFNAVCRELWCLAGTSARAAHPALEGSSCGDNGRVCREGKCVQV